MHLVGVGLSVQPLSLRLLRSCSRSRSLRRCVVPLTLPWTRHHVRYMLNALTWFVKKFALCDTITCDC